MTGAPPETGQPGDPVERLLDVLYQRYQYDFRAYARPPVHRGILRAQGALGIATTDELARRVVSEPTVVTELLRHLTIHVSEFFRDPFYYRALRQCVLPHLATYPFPRVWVAGCGSGEEAYSIATVLHEEGLLERSLIYATDIDAASLQIAEAGVFANDCLDGFAERYFAAGGRAEPSDYYVAADGGVAIRRMLKKKILFANHSLATDAVFAEVHLVSCRNVFIYFESALRRRAVEMFRDALAPRGFLGLGAKETLAGCDATAAFEPFAADERIYRLKGGHHDDRA